MTDRWLSRISGGIAAFILSWVMVLPLAHSRILNRQKDTSLADACSCSTCSDGYYCCHASGGRCYCILNSLKCP